MDRHEWHFDAARNSLTRLLPRLEQAYAKEIAARPMRWNHLKTGFSGSGNGCLFICINPDLGTMEELSQLAAALRERGISLVLDFVFNHTSDEHVWAQRAKAGEAEFLNYYLTFTDRTLVDRFQEHLRDIFPSVRNGGMEMVDTGNAHLFAYIRGAQKQRLLIINNFSDFDQFLSTARLASAGMTEDAQDLFSRKVFKAGEDLKIEGYRYLWLDISDQRTAIACTDV